MTKTTNRSSLAQVYGRKQDRYLELVRQHPLRPIRSEEELDDAIRAINSLIDRDRLSVPEQDYLEVLSDLVEAYETVHYPEAVVPDADMLEHLLEAKGVTQVQAAKGARVAESTISEVLSGKRKLTRGQIGKLARYFHVAPGVFEFGE